MQSLLQGLKQVDEREFIGISNCYVLNQQGQLTHLAINDRSTVELTELGDQPALTHLYLRDNKLTSLPEAITRLQNLQTLDLSSNNLTSLPEAITQWQNLKVLSLSNNNLTSLPETITQWQNLQILGLNGNNLTCLPEAITQWQNLKRLDISNNNLTSLPEAITQWQNLRELYLRGNKLTSLPEAITQWQNLKILSLSGNNLTRLPEAVAQLGNLELLDLNSNKLTTLPTALLKLPNLRHLELTNNPITKHLNGIEKQLKPRELISYLLEVQNKQTKPLNEAKVLVVGDERVGKTSLIKRLLGQRHNPNQATTAGIDIRNHQLSNGIQVNIWDFAGQEITHQTHQFFLSTRSLYLYVLDSQKEDNDSAIYHWLSVIKANGDNSPIVIVVNKRDLNVGYTFDLHRYQGDFNIVAVLELSAENDDAIAPEVKSKITHTIDDLTRCIEQQVAALDDIQFPLPQTWAKVKAELEAMSGRAEDFIENEDYEILCKKNRIYNPLLQDTLLTILNQIGTIVTYKNNNRLKVMQIINPLWVTNGVYKIIRSPLITNNALLNQAQFEQIFHDEAKYKIRHYNWLKDLLNQFELSFNVDDTTILIPSKLNPNQPQFNLADFQQGLNFRYRYHSLLKKSVISQFIVKMKDYIVTTGDKYWQRGVFLHYGDCQGVVIADEEKKTIVIAINTNGRMAQGLLSIIRHTLRTVNGKNLRCDEQVPLIIDGRIIGYEDYDYLVDCEQKGEKDIRLKIALDGQKSHRFTITELLDGYRLKEDTRFDYDKLTRDLIAISQLETENKHAINGESEDQTNDRFKTALLNRQYIVADQARGGTSESGNSAGERDLVIRNNNTGVVESVIEAFILKGLDTKEIKTHYNKLVNNYDTTGNRRNFILVYAKTANFEDLWQQYQDCFEGFEDTSDQHSGKATDFTDLWKKYKKYFKGFNDTSDQYSGKTKVKTGITKINKQDVFHIFINFHV